MEDDRPTQSTKRRKVFDTIWLSEILFISTSFNLWRCDQGNENEPERKSRQALQMLNTGDRLHGLKRQNASVAAVMCRAPLMQDLTKIPCMISNATVARPYADHSKASMYKKRALSKTTAEVWACGRCGGVHRKR